MLKKNYTLSDVHSFLIKNNFKKVYKNKMFLERLLNIYIQIIPI